MKRLSCMVLTTFGLLGGLLGCIGSSVKIEPVTVRPIHMTIDVNLHDAAAPHGEQAARPAAP